MNNVFFWQNIISPHQSSILKNLSILPGFSVTLVVERYMDRERMKMGWEVGDLGLSKVVIAPGKPQIVKLLNENREGFHIFSGTRGYPMVWFALKSAIRLKCQFAIMSEPGNWVGMKGLLRKWRSQIDAMFLRGKVRFILAIGYKGVEWFKSCGYSREKIFNWGYFIDVPENVRIDRCKTADDSFSIIYVGRIAREKGLLQFLQQVAGIDLPYRLSIIGEGTELKSVEQFVHENNLHSKVTFFEFMSNSDVLKHIASADVLVLPSTGKDGWGVVVNEALLLGTPVICSSNCGSSVLLSHPSRGDVFDPNDLGKLSLILERRISLGRIQCSDRVVIQKWAQNISSNAATRYLASVLAYATHKKSIRPEAPWIEEFMK